MNEGHDLCSAWVQSLKGTPIEGATSEAEMSGFANMHNNGKYFINISELQRLVFGNSLLRTLMPPLVNMVGKQARDPLSSYVVVASSLTEAAQSTMA